ncbi:MAG: sorting protein [Prosthecobacter sp.]|nr:sorting protein [Prosthecobacter sp.]
MKKHSTKLWGAAILLAASVMLATPASAAVTWTDSDIVLAFRSSADPGNNVAYLVNIGDASLFAPGASSIANLNTFSGFGDIGADLVATFGTGAGSGTEWYNRSDLYWGLFSTDTTQNPAVNWFSKAETTVGTAATSWGTRNNNSRNGAQSGVNSVTSTFSTATGTVNSNGKGFVQTNGASTYDAQVSQASDFGSLANFTGSGIEGNFANGTAGTALDLFKFTDSSTTTNLGSFSISNSGVVSFTAPAGVPEPSKAIFGMAGLATVFMRRRRPAARA